MKNPLRFTDRYSRGGSRKCRNAHSLYRNRNYHFGSSGLPVGRGGRLVVSGAHGLVVVGVLREYQPVGDVKVGFERVIDVIVESAAHAVHRVPGTVALAHQIVP